MDIYNDFIIDEDFDNEPRINIPFYVENQTYNSVDICKEYVNRATNTKIAAKTLNSILVDKGVITVHDDLPKYRLVNSTLGIVYEKAIRYNKYGLLVIDKILRDIGYEYVKTSSHYKNIYQYISDSSDLSNISDIVKDYTNSFNQKLVPVRINNILKEHGILEDGHLTPEYLSIGENQIFQQKGQYSNFVKYNKIGKLVIFYILLDYGYYPVKIDSDYISNLINKNYFEDLGVSGITDMYNNGLFNYNNIEKFIEDVYTKLIHYKDLMKFYKHQDTNSLLNSKKFIGVLTSRLSDGNILSNILYNNRFTDKYSDCGTIIGNDIFINEKGLKIIHERLISKGYVLNTNYNIG